MLCSMRSIMPMIFSAIRGDRARARMSDSPPIISVTSATRARPPASTIRSATQPTQRLLDNPLVTSLVPQLMP